MRIAVVINAASGSALGRDAIEAEVARHLAAHGLDAIIVPEHEDGLLARLDAAVAQGADAVVVGGGDGTITAAAARLMGGTAALGILPLGTMNMLAKDLGIPLELDGRLDRGHGMASMKQRAKQMQGQCLIESGPGYGTVIRLTLPL